MTRQGFLRIYVAVVSAAGLGVLAGLAASGGLKNIANASAAYWVFAAFLVAGELFPISIPRSNGQVDEITMSATFAFALMIGFGTAAAALTQTVASLVSDSVRRKQPWKIAFNLGQYTLSVAAAGGVYRTLGGDGHIATSDLGIIVLSAITFVVLNTVLTSIALALAQDEPVLAYVWRDLRFDSFTAPVLLALGPVVVVVADRSLWLVPLVAAPAVAVYWGTKLALENTRLVGELKGSLEHMTELNRMKDDFVAVVSHELRTPLTSIQGYIKTLLQLSPELEETQRRSFLEAADRQSERLRRLIEQTLVVARLESHVEPLIVGPVSFQRVVAHVIDELRPRAHGHVFDQRIAPDLPEIQTDEAKVHQIVSNLVENALKYSQPDTRVTIRVDPGVGGVALTVEDEGPGIPPEAQEKVFERFFQVDSSATRKVGGTGLGLYICKKMADAIGARLWLVQSDVEGSEFCLFVPEHPPAPEERAEPASPQSMTARV